jgi:rare lipoprotein A
MKRLLIIAPLILAALPAQAGSFTALASFYGGGREHLNARTANGERFRPSGMTAAHRGLKFGTRILVSYQGKSVVVRINDRGPNIRTGRSLDLSRGAAARLGIIRKGVAPVTVAILD